MLSELLISQKLQKFIDREKAFFYNIYEDSINTLLFIIDMDGFIVKTIGGKFHPVWKEEDLVGRKYCELLDAGDIEMTGKHYQDIEEGKSQLAEFKISTNQRIVVMPIQDKNEIIGFYGLAELILAPIDSFSLKF